MPKIIGYSERESRAWLIFLVPRRLHKCANIIKFWISIKLIFNISIYQLVTMRTSKIFFKTIFYSRNLKFKSLEAIYAGWTSPFTRNKQKIWETTVFEGWKVYIWKGYIVEIEAATLKFKNWWDIVIIMDWLLVKHLKQKS